MLRSFLPILAVTIALTYRVRVARRKSRRRKPAPDRDRADRDDGHHPGIEVLARIALPDGFVPSPRLSADVAAGRKGSRRSSARATAHAVIMGYGGTGYRTARVIAEDGGIGAPDGSIVDLAASPTEWCSRSRS